jgi:hypothetical protein
MTNAPRRPVSAKEAIETVEAGARPAVDAALAAGLAAFDRAHALSPFHRLTRETINSEAPEAARAVVREIGWALRAERARAGHWTYDLNRHVALLIAYRAETARLCRLLKRSA